MKVYFLFICILFSITGFTQVYENDMHQYRESYKLHFVLDANSPLKAADTGYLQFFPPDTNYRLDARFTATPRAKEFDMPTYSGQMKKYRQYGLLTFTVNDTVCTLQVYQSLALMKKRGLKDYLFIPFADQTNYITTYAGGRYIELRTGDIKNDSVILDFNKCYNPYCAYADGYSCPVPPDANKLPVAIPAGEMQFGKKTD